MCWPVESFTAHWTERTSGKRSIEAHVPRAADRVKVVAAVSNFATRIAEARLLPQRVRVPERVGVRIGGEVVEEYSDALVVDYRIDVADPSGRNDRQTAGQVLGEFRG